MTLQQLKYAVAVADTRNITEASKRVFISQPSLTAAIQDLENEMNVKILDNKINSFRFILKLDKDQTVFEIVCFDASYGFEEYKKINPYSTILTSGTLSTNSIQSLLNVKFDKILNNDHVINNNQFIFNIITEYKSDTKIKDYSFTYKNKNDILQIKSLGNDIYNLVNSVTIGGVLVFFQSFEYLKQCHINWLENGIFKKYEKIKEVIFDLEFNRADSEERINKAKKKHNLLLFTVYRGKNSEGINFPNDEARMVICVGVPFPNLSDMRVQLKMDLLNVKNNKRKINFEGRKWYKEEAMNAVNQSLGRLIRNINDYGIMICFGVEFLEHIGYLTKWIRNNKIEIVSLNDNEEKYFQNLTKFLSNSREKYPVIENNSDNIYYENDIYDIDDFFDESDFSEDNNKNNFKSSIYSEKKEYNFGYDNQINKYKLDSNNFNNSDLKDKNTSIGHKRYREKSNDEDEDCLIM